jgi:hypothetical protein
MLNLRIVGVSYSTCIALMRVFTCLEISQLFQIPLQFVVNFFLLARRGFTQHVCSWKCRFRGQWQWQRGVINIRMVSQKTFTNLYPTSSERGTRISDVGFSGCTYMRTLLNGLFPSHIGHRLVDGESISSFDWHHYSSISQFFVNKEGGENIPDLCSW